LTGGRLGGSWGKAPVLLLTTTGRRTRREYTTPLLYLDCGDRLAVVATNNGAPHHPAWYRNLLAHSGAMVRLKDRSLAVEARTASVEERAELWPRLVAIYPNYERDQRRIQRELPVVVLERLN
jgi:deazaflavin-dependent oxidoreductase (nitroreductase family)